MQIAIGEFIAEDNVEAVWRPVPLPLPSAFPKALVNVW